jgi:hypothetical protein
MNIIFDSPQVELLRQRHVLLELDSFLIGSSSKPIKSWCVIEQIPINEIYTSEHYQKLHASLIEHYQKKNWTVCKDAIALLKGQWGGELDSFYETLFDRINQLAEQDLPDSWNSVIIKN